MTIRASCGALGAAAFLSCLPASAHVTFEGAEAPVDSTYKAVLRVPHGCSGQATRAIRVTVPEGVLDVKPMPKPGWTLRVEPASSGKEVRAIVWEGGELPDAFYDEFVFRARLSAIFAGRAVAFPVVQDCGTASERWTDIAAEGQDAHALKFPAPVVRVAAKTGAALFRAGAIAIERPWARATPGGAKVGGGYMRITNTGSEPDRLIGGSFAAAGRFEVHDMQVGADNVMRMRPVEGGLVIRPGESVELKPGGYHAMLMDLQRPLKEGETLAGTLRFEKAGTVEVVYAVRGIGAQEAGAGTHEHH